MWLQIHTIPSMKHTIEQKVKFLIIQSIWCSFGVTRWHDIWAIQKNVHFPKNMEMTIWKQSCDLPVQWALHHITWEQLWKHFFSLPMFVKVIHQQPQQSWLFETSSARFFLDSDSYFILVRLVGAKIFKLKPFCVFWLVIYWWSLPNIQPKANFTLIWLYLGKVFCDWPRLIVAYNCIQHLFAFILSFNFKELRWPLKKER